MAKQPKTYTAPHPVYVDRQYHKANHPFTTAADKGEDWEELNKVEKAVADAQEDIPGDAPLDDLEINGLRAVAVEKHVNSKGLSKKELITAITAANEPRL